ncbi:MAG TPA: WYL domain-containing protein [Anaerolineales bacterium]|nr:WYL domain-containing protein [Anaerolineales bacterium]
MRADRLLSIVLLLNARGRQTARGLASELGVSERTVYRDIEALSVAGVPIYTQAGPEGGVFLDEHYRVTLTGLNPDQVRALFVSSAVGPLRDLGLANAHQDSQLKLFAALSAAQRAEAERMRQRIYIDPTLWFQVAEGLDFMPELQRAVWEDRRIVVEYHAVESDWRRRELDAYGLVAKANVWYVIGRKSDGAWRSYRVGRLRAVEVLEARFERDPGFDLMAYWREACGAFERESLERYPTYTATLRVHADADWYFPGFFEGRYTRLSAADATGWSTLRVTFNSADDARTRLLGLGTAVEVVEPAELARAVLETARAIVARGEHASRDAVA